MSSQVPATVQTGGANIRVVGADASKTQKVDTAHLINITGNMLGSRWRAVELRNVLRVMTTGNTI